jgi:hypothetical protein
MELPLRVVVSSTLDRLAHRLGILCILTALVVAGGKGAMIPRQEMYLKRAERKFLLAGYQPMPRKYCAFSQQPAEMPLHPERSKIESRVVVRASSLQAWLLMACHVVSSLQSSNPDLPSVNEYNSRSLNRLHAMPKLIRSGGALTDVFR